MLDASQPVAVARGLLEPLVGGRFLHLPLELALNRLDVPRQELDHLIDDRPVVLLRHVADAGREAAFDVVVEAGNPRVTARLRPLARPVREDAVQDVQRLAHLLRVRVRPEVDDPASVALAREHDARILVLHGDGDVRERLVVTQPDVERRPVPLDEVLLEVQGLDLVLRDDHLDVLHALRQLLNRRSGVLRLLKVRPHPRPQRLGLSDVEHVPGPVPKEVDARLGRQAFSWSSSLEATSGQPSPAAMASPRRPRSRKAARVERPGRRKSQGLVKEGGELPGGPLRREPWQHNPDSCQLSVLRPAACSPQRGILRGPRFRSGLTPVRSPFLHWPRPGFVSPPGHPLAAASIPHRIRLRPRGAGCCPTQALGERQDVHGRSRGRGPERRSRGGDGQDGAGQGRRLRHDPNHGDLGARSDRRSRRTSSPRSSRSPQPGDFLGIRIVATVMNFGSKTTPLTATARIAVRPLRRRHRQTRPENPRVHRRQRAEPQPLLAATVRPERRGRGCDGVRAAARAHLRRDEGGGPGTSSSTAARWPRAASTRPGTGRDTHSPTAFITDMGTAYRA